MSKDKPSPNEVKLMLEGFVSATAEWRKSVDETLKEIKDDGKETKEHAKYTNGRVTKLEDWSSNAATLIEELIKAKSDLVKEANDIKSDMKSKWTGIKWAGSVIMVIGSVAATLYIKEVSTTTAKESVNQLEKQFNLQYEKNTIKEANANT